MRLGDRFWVRLWFWSRQRAIAAISESRSKQLSDARRAWERDARLAGELATPAWVTRGLSDDLALHDAADSLLGKHA